MIEKFIEIKPQLQTSPLGMDQTHLLTDNDSDTEESEEALKTSLPKGANSTYKVSKQTLENIVQKRQHHHD